MRKYRYLAVAVGAATVLSVSAGAAVAASAHTASVKSVLTIGKLGGAAVKKGAVIKAGLPKKGKVVLTIGSVSVPCTSSSIAAKVVKNPAKAGEASLSVTSVSVSKCATVKELSLSISLSLKAINLPYGSTIKTSKGDPVGLSEASKSKPMGFRATASSGGKVLAVCVFTAAKVSGSASNKHNTVAFSKQPFTLNKALTGAAYSTCAILGTTSKFTATYGPLVDSSVKHSPKVFVS
jgi:hypothetical protein